MVWVRLPVYFYKRNETFYFSRAIPSDLLHRYNKLKIEVSLRTKSEEKATEPAAALFDQLVSISYSICKENQLAKITKIASLLFGDCVLR